MEKVKSEKLKLNNISLSKEILLYIVENIAILQSSF